MTAPRQQHHEGSIGALRWPEVLHREMTLLDRAHERKPLEALATLMIVRPDDITDADVLLTAFHSETVMDASKMKTAIVDREKLTYFSCRKWLKDRKIMPSSAEELANRFNAMIDDPKLPDNARWLRDAVLRPFTRGLLASYDEKSADTDVTLLNRMLLEDAFPHHLPRVDAQHLERLYAAASVRGQSALCLSGGGIRSATFALGVVQVLAQKGALHKFDYLSTVSGGGYLGGWLSAWRKRIGFNNVIDALNNVRRTPLDPEPDPVRHLRGYSSYLAPRLSALSADTWTLIATYTRNLLVDWLVIVPILASVVFVPWLCVAIGNVAANELSAVNEALPGAVLAILLVGGVLLLIRAVVFVHTYRPESDTTLSAPVAERSLRDQTSFLHKCLVPMIAAAVLLAWGWLWFVKWHLTTPGFKAAYDALTLDESTRTTHWRGYVWFATAGALLHLIGGIIAGRLGYQSMSKKHLAGHFLLILLTGGAGGALVLAVLQQLTPADTTMYAWLAPSAVIASILLAGFAFEGLISALTGDAEREWTARFSAWLLIVVVGWLALGGLVIFGPMLAQMLRPRIAAALGISSGILSAILGKSAASPAGGPGHDSTSSPKKFSMTAWPTRFVLPVATIVAIIALIVALSWMDTLIVKHICESRPDWCGAEYWFQISDHFSWEVVNGRTVTVVLFGFLGLLLLGMAFGRVIDTNKFSLHAMYRARLIRAYLGASRPSGERNPDPFTGFDEGDNLPMGTLIHQPPLHVVNVALNLVHGENLAWQERKAESFTITPLHAGSANLGYRETHIEGQADPPEKNDRYYGGDTGISLGTAITISGAAASPNMGYNSSPAITFLMTLFNARLGWWLGNPGPAGAKTFHRKSPRISIRPIFDEMFGFTDDKNPYCYLSDGGHFDNLGLYEMVARRCRLIVVVDASCDEECSLADLGNAIRKIRIDLGVPVLFEKDFPIRSKRDAANTPGRYWAFGRIKYSKIDVLESGPDAEKDGVLVYVKPGVYGMEPRDIFNYARVSAAFPHESTADQFFSETQFESYRALGEHAMNSLNAAHPLPLMFEPAWRKATLADQP